MSRQREIQLTCGQEALKRLAVPQVVFRLQLSPSSELCTENDFVKLQH